MIQYDWHISQLFMLEIHKPSDVHGKLWAGTNGETRIRQIWERTIQTLCSAANLIRSFQSAPICMYIEFQIPCFIYSLANIYLTIILANTISIPSTVLNAHQLNSNSCWSYQWWKYSIRLMVNVPNWFHSSPNKCETQIKSKKGRKEERIASKSPTHFELSNSNL